MSELDSALVWYGSEASAREYARHYARMLDSDMALRSYEPEEEGRFGGYDDLIQVYDDVAVVSVNGSLGYKENMFTRYFGMMTYETLSNVLAELVNDGSIKTALLDIDSPGGTAKGISLASEAIGHAQEAGLRVVAHTTGEMLSAAYWIGSSADSVYATKSAEVGSVGVVMVHMEMTEALAKDGIQVKVFRKGDEKALGSPYEPLTEKAAASIDRRLENAYTAFIDTVANNRSLDAGFVRESVATGRVFTASEAQELGLIDGMQSFNSLVNNLIPKAATNSLTGATAMSKTPILSEAPAGLDPEAMNLNDPTVAAAMGEPDADEDEPAGETVQDDESEDEGGEEDGAEGEEQAQTQDSSAVQAMSALMADLNRQLVESRVALQQATVERDELRAANAGLRQIVIEQTQNLRIRLGQSAGSDLEGMSDATLVATHQAVKADFVSRFKSGPQSRVPEKDTTVPSAVVTRLDLGVRKATSFK